MSKSILKGCNLSFDDYTNHHLWVGKAKNKNCTNPSVLRRQISTRVEDLGIGSISITTFDQNEHSLNPNNSSLLWTKVFYHGLRDCLTMTLPKNLVRLGIFQIFIQVQNPPSPHLMIYVHQKGLLFTDMPVAWQQVDLSGDGYSVSIDHEVVGLLKYDGEACEDDEKYRFDDCKLEDIHKVNSKRSTYIVSGF